MFPSFGTLPNNNTLSATIAAVLLYVSLSAVCFSGLYFNLTKAGFLYHLLISHHYEVLHRFLLK